MFNKKMILIICLIATGCAPSITVKKKIFPNMLFTTSVSEVEPGHSIRLTVETDSNELKLYAYGWWKDGIEINPVPETPTIFEHFVSIPLDTVAGDYSVTVTAYSGDQSLLAQNRIIKIKERSPFKTVNLWIKSFGQYNFSPESAVMNKARKDALMAKREMPRIGRFIWPVRGRITEMFGVKRVYNDGVSSWYHGGIDIAAPGGTEILAPAYGVVILSEDFAAHGNTILIDHGYGVVTAYLHQKKRLVGVGDVVEQGQVIGQVGTTGSSTGNHLHYQININNIVATPFDFFETYE